MQLQCSIKAMKVDRGTFCWRDLSTWLSTARERWPHWRKAMILANWRSSTMLQGKLSRNGFRTRTIYPSSRRMFWRFQFSVFCIFVWMCSQQICIIRHICRPKKKKNTTTSLTYSAGTCTFRRASAIKNSFAHNVYRTSWLLGWLMAARFVRLQRTAHSCVVPITCVCVICGVSLHHLSCNFPFAATQFKF